MTQKRTREWLSPQKRTTRPARRIRWNRSPPIPNGASPTKDKATTRYGGRRSDFAQTSINFPASKPLQRCSFSNTYPIWFDAILVYLSLYQYLYVNDHKSMRQCGYQQLDFPIPLRKHYWGLNQDVVLLRPSMSADGESQQLYVRQYITGNRKLYVLQISAVACKLRV